MCAIRSCSFIFSSPFTYATLVFFIQIFMRFIRNKQPHKLFKTLHFNQFLISFLPIHISLSSYRFIYLSFYSLYFLIHRICICICFNHSNYLRQMEITTTTTKHINIKSIYFDNRTKQNREFGEEISQAVIMMDF